MPSQASQLPHKACYSLLIYTTQAGCQAAVLLLLILLLILSAPPKYLSDYGHTEPRRGAECWGKSPLLTLGWAGIPALFQSEPP